MHPRASELVTRLNLTPHPEGGYFTRAFRSESTVFPSDSRGSRSALSAIYFLLVEGTFSRWHRVASDEAWNHYEGSPLEIFSASPMGGAAIRHTLGPLSATSAPLYVVPSGWWQAAQSLGPYSLVGCSVGPGFEYDDFALLSGIPAAERPHFVPPSLQDAFL
jgi:predicted cupin superfamily sugar epimerase